MQGMAFSSNIHFRFVPLTLTEQNFTIVNIRGSNMAQAGDFECLDNSPCEGESFAPCLKAPICRRTAHVPSCVYNAGITLQDVQLRDYQKGFECKNAYGASRTFFSPARGSLFACSSWSYLQLLYASFLPR